MKKFGLSLLLVCVFGGLAVYRLRGAPIPLLIGMVPLLALALFLITANPDDPKSLTTRFLTRTGFYKVVQDAHASTQGGGGGGILIRALVVLGMILWFLAVMKFWPA